MAVSRRLVVVGCAGVIDWFLVHAVRLIFLFCLQFFRDPARVIAGGPKSIVAPADGRVVVVEEADDPYLNRRALKVSVFMNVFNVHSEPLAGGLHGAAKVV